MDIDYVEIANSIAGTIARVTKPLTNEQRRLLAGVIAPYFEKYMADARKQAVRMAKLKAEADEHLSKVE